MADKPTKRAAVPQHTVRCADGRLLSLRLTRKLAMAACCTECMGFESGPQDCTSKLCPMWPYRAKTLRTKRGNIPEVDHA